MRIQNYLHKLIHGSMATLGGVKFSTFGLSYSAVRSNEKYRWKRHDVVGGEPVYQFLGRGKNRLIFKGNLYRSFHVEDPQNSIGALKVKARKGEPVSLAIASSTGEGLAGRYVITQISENQSYIQSDGTPLKNSYTIELEELEGSTKTMALK